MSQQIVFRGGPFDGSTDTAPEFSCPRVTLMKRGEQYGHGYIPTDRMEGETQVWEYDGQKV